MYKNVLLMRNGCEDCSMKTCLGVLLAESLNAKVTAAYVTGDFTWQELRKVYGLDELKWSGAARAGKDAKEAAEERKVRLAKEALESTERMCAERGIRCEKLHLSSKSPMHGALKVAAEKKCDVIVTSIQPHWLTQPLFDVKQAVANGRSRIPVLFHNAV
jgi:nucleotide-binding universal stress UspA family protein